MALPGPLHALGFCDLQEVWPFIHIDVAEYVGSNLPRVHLFCLPFFVCPGPPRLLRVTLRCFVLLCAARVVLCRIS